MFILLFLLVSVGTADIKRVHAAPTYEIRLNEDSENLVLTDITSSKPSWYEGEAYFACIPEDTKTIQFKFSEETGVGDYIGNMWQMVEADTWTTIDMEGYIAHDDMYDPEEGYLCLNKSFQHYNLEVFDGDDNTIITFFFQLGGSAQVTTDKTALQAAIATDVSGYYDADDRWNGKEYLGAEGSFYATYTAALAYANTINGNEQVGQDFIDEATEALVSAIGNLISKENVNATLLYEKIQEIEGLNEITYTPTTWGNLQSALAEAKSMLASLHSEGSPTEINVTAYQTDVDGMVEELNTAKENLVWAAGEDRADEAARAYNDVKNLAKLFNPEEMNKEVYTDESWEEFIATRDAA